MRGRTLLAVITVLTFTCNAAAQDKLRFSAIDAQALTPVAERVVSRAYAELGIEVETVVSTPRRALIDSASGKNDGELVRVRHIGSQQRTLIRIDVPVFISHSVALVRDRELVSMPIGDLKHLRAGHIAGANYARKITEGFSEIWTGETPEQLLEMLLHDRVDLIVLGEETANKVLAPKQVNSVFRLAQGPGVVCFYHYLHKKHAALVPRVEEALRRTLGDVGDDPCAPPENGLLEEGNEIAYHAEAS